MSASYFLDGEDLAQESAQPFKFHPVYFKGPEKVGETAEEKEYAKIILEKWEHNQKMFGDLEDKNAERVSSMNSEAAQDFAEGAVKGNVQTQFGKAKTGLKTSMNRAGINPNSGRAKATEDSFADSQGESLGVNATRAGNAQQDEYLQGKENIIAMGQGKASTAQAGFGGLASSAASVATQDAARAYQERAANQEAIGTVVGAAANYGLNSTMNTKPVDTTDASIGLDYGQMTT